MRVCQTIVERLFKSDEVESDEDLAARQPEEQWLARANWRAHDYQSRLRA